MRRTWSVRFPEYGRVTGVGVSLLVYKLEKEQIFVLQARVGLGDTNVAPSRPPVARVNLS